MQRRECHGGNATRRKQIVGEWGSGTRALQQNTRGPLGPEKSRPLKGTVLARTRVARGAHVRTRHERNIRSSVRGHHVRLVTEVTPSTAWSNISQIASGIGHGNVTIFTTKPEENHHSGKKPADKESWTIENITSLRSNNASKDACRSLILEMGLRFRFISNYGRA